MTNGIQPITLKQRIAPILNWIDKHKLKLFEYAIGTAAAAVGGVYYFSGENISLSEKVDQGVYQEVEDNAFFVNAQNRMNVKKGTKEYRFSDNEGLHAWIGAMKQLQT